MQRRRVFVAHVLDAPVATEIDGLRRALGSPERERIAPHVTLVPPRNVADDELDVVFAHLRRVAAAHRPATIELVGARVFLPERRVVHLGVADPSGLLASLERSLGVEVLEPPVQRDTRPFVPHVTLLGRATPVQVDAALVALAAFRASVTVAGISLLVEETDPPPRRWRVVGDVALAASAASGRGGFEIVIERSTIVPLDATRLLAPARTDALVLIARLEDRAVGVLSGRIVGRTFLLDAHVVEQSHRFEGVGTRLLNSLEGFGREMGFEEVLVIVQTDTAPARFYAGRGYAPAGAGSEAGAESLIRRVGRLAP